MVVELPDATRVRLCHTATAARCVTHRLHPARTVVLHLRTAHTVWWNSPALASPNATTMNAEALNSLSHHNLPTTTTASAAVDALNPASAQPAAIEEPTYTAKEQQLLTDMRQQLTARLSSGKLEPAADFKPPHSLHWRDIYNHYRHLTVVEATPDPRHSTADAPLPRPQDWPDYQLYRFLKAREYNVRRGVDMLLNALHYRRQFGVDDLMAQSACPFKDFQQLFLTDKYHYTDRHGHPLILNYLSRALLEQLPNYYPAAVAYVTEVWDMEKGLELQQQSSQQLGKRVTLFSVILDTKGATLAHQRLLHYLQPILWTDDHIFPESMFQLIIGNAPSVVSVLWQLVQVFIDKQTRAKFVFLSAGHDEDVKRLIGAKETPVEWSGQCDRCGGECAPKLTEWNEGWKRIGRGTAGEVQQWEAGGKEHKVGLAARYDHEVRLKVHKQKPDGEHERVTVWWSFTIDAKDIDFSLAFHPTVQPPPHVTALLTPTYHLIAPTRLSCDAGTVHRGCHHFSVRTSRVDEGVCVLKWSNSMSTFSSKTVHVKAGVLHSSGTG